MIVGLLGFAESVGWKAAKDSGRGGGNPGNALLPDSGMRKYELKKMLH